MLVIKAGLFKEADPLLPSWWHIGTIVFLQVLPRESCPIGSPYCRGTWQWCSSGAAPAGEQGATVVGVGVVVVDSLLGEEGGARGAARGHGHQGVYQARPSLLHGPLARVHHMSGTKLRVLGFHLHKDNVGQILPWSLKPAFQVVVGQECRISTGQRENSC